MSNFDTTTPSVRQIQNIIQEKTLVEVKLITSDIHVGKIRWQDPNCICLLDQDDSMTLVWREAIVYLKPKT